MRCPTLSELPAPPTGKAGWPWTEESRQLPDAMPDGRPWPRVSIVTPSYNQGQFIEETIRSVLLQGYSNLEYIIIDGGSTDNSVDIIRKYAPWLAHWESEADRGQSHALNKGFQQTTGEIMAWLNSDDLYYSDTLAYVALRLSQPNHEILIGAMNKVEIRQGKVEFVKRSSPYEGNRVHVFPIFSNGRCEDFHFIQPPMFWRRALWNRAGNLDERYHYIMDREWIMRALANDARLLTVEKVLARFAVHPESKSQTDTAFVAERALMYWRLGQDVRFRRLPCVMESLLAALQYLQRVSRLRAQDLNQRDRCRKAFLYLLAAKVLRANYLVVNTLSPSQRVTRKNKLDA